MWISDSSEYHEEYAVYQGRNIMGGKYNEGEPLLDGKIFDLKGKKELRIRYLTPYNFIICLQITLINETKNDYIMGGILKGILRVHVRLMILWDLLMGWKDITAIYIKKNNEAV